MLSSGLPVCCLDEWRNTRGFLSNSFKAFSPLSPSSSTGLEIPEQQSTNCTTNFCINYKLQQRQPPTHSSAMPLFVRMWWVNRTMWTITWTLTLHRNINASQVHMALHNPHSALLSTDPLYSNPHFPTSFTPKSISACSTAQCCSFVCRVVLRLVNNSTNYSPLVGD